MSKKFGKKKGEAGIVPLTPPAPRRGVSSYVPGLGLGFGASSPQHQTLQPYPHKKAKF